MDNPEIDDYGDQRWRDEDGMAHRDDGPAVIRAHGMIMWCQHGDYHRTDGPAVIYADGTTRWWWNGKGYTFDKWLDVVDISDEAKVMMKLKYG